MQPVKPIVPRPPAAQPKRERLTILRMLMGLDVILWALSVLGLFALYLRGAFELLISTNPDVKGDVAGFAIAGIAGVGILVTQLVALTFFFAAILAILHVLDRMFR